MALNRYINYTISNRLTPQNFLKIMNGLFQPSNQGYNYLFGVYLLHLLTENQRMLL